MVAVMRSAESAEVRRALERYVVEVVERMTRGGYDGCVTRSAESAEVRRVLERYLVEVVERYDVCPWARPAMLQSSIRGRSG